MKIKKKHMAEILARMCNSFGSCPKGHANLKECPLVRNVACDDITPKHWLEAELSDKEDDKMK